jgi:hypothetical protein
VAASQVLVVVLVLVLVAPSSGQGLHRKSFM